MRSPAAVPSGPAQAARTPLVRYKSFQYQADSLDHAQAGRVAELLRKALEWQALLCLAYNQARERGLQALSIRVSRPHVE